MFSHTIKDYDNFTFIVILFVEVTMGVLGNGFILLVNIMDWTKRRRIPSVDQILSTLALTRFLEVCYLLIYMLLFILCPHLIMRPETLKSTRIIWVVKHHFSIWLATCLGIFYFLKIANFSKSFFLYLKWRVKKVVLMIMLVSLIFLILNLLSLKMYDHLTIDAYEENMSYSLINSTQFPRIFSFAKSSKVFLITSSSHYFLPINSLFMLIPFTVSLASFLLLIFSLWKHHKKMQVSVERPRDASTMAHIKALQTGLSFLLLYAIYLLFIVTGLLSLGFIGGKFILLFDHISGILFQIIHSFVLILGNSKLRQAALSVLRGLRCWAKDMDTMGP